MDNVPPIPPIATDFPQKKTPLPFKTVDLCFTNFYYIEFLCKYYVEMTCKTAAAAVYCGKEI